MQCPVCVKTALVAEKPGNGLSVQRCTSCDGRWLPFDEHQRWVASGEAEKSVEGAAAVASSLEGFVEGAHRPRLCPRCGRFLTRHRISLDLPFTLDRCGVCAGVWFEAGEWVAVETRGMLPRLNYLFNDAHQHKMAQEQKRREYEARCRTIVGEESYQRAVEIRKWLAGHPHAGTIRAFLDGGELGG